MKILFDTDVVTDILIRGDEFPDSLKLFNALLDAPDFSLWISALSIVILESTVPKSSGRMKVQNVTKLLNQKLSIIPLRKSTFHKATVIKAKNSGDDLEDAIQLAGAEETGMDFIVTRDKEKFRETRVMVATPTEFLDKWNVGHFNRVSQVPFMDLGAQYHQIYNEIDDRINDVISRSAFILGNYVQEFEKDFAAAQGARHCIGVSSGTDALHLALLALDIGPGDAVVVPVNTFFATAEAVALTGARCVFVEQDEYFHLDARLLEQLLRETRCRVQDCRIRAIIPVHLYGQSANMDNIMELALKYNLEVVEDCAQAHLSDWQGQKVGNFGAFGAFSFYPGKNLGAFGEAGALTVNDARLYEKARSMRGHGETTRYSHQYFGHNYRMENFQGAVLSTKLKYLSEWTARRQENATLYNDLLSGIREIRIPDKRDNAGHVFHLYVIRARDRDALQAHLQARGVSTGLHYPEPLHLQKACASLGYGPGDFPVAEQSAREILSLPMFPELSSAQIRYVCECLGEFYN